VHAFSYYLKERSKAMKKIEIVIKPERLEKLKVIMDECGATGLMISNIMGYGNQKGYTALYRGTKYTVNLLPKILISTITTDEKAQCIIDRMLKELPTGEQGDGKIFVYDVAEVIRIRTGEKGENAL